MICSLVNTWVDVEWSQRMNLLCGQVFQPCWNFIRLLNVLGVTILAIVAADCCRRCHPARVNLAEMAELDRTAGAASSP